MEDGAEVEERARPWKTVVAATGVGATNAKVMIVGFVFVAN